LQHVFKYVIVDLRGVIPLVLPHLKFKVEEVVAMTKKDFLILALLVIIILEIIFD